MRIHLGAGEEGYRRVHAAHALEQRRGVALVLSPHPEALDECRRRLEAAAPRLVRVEPARDVVGAVSDVARGAPHAPGPPVAWIEARRGAPLQKAWLRALAGLNQQREELGREGGIFIVLAGPPELGPIVRERAPDLWSVSRPTVVLEEVPQMVSGGVVQWVHLSDIHLRAGEDWQQRVVLSALVRDLPGLLGEAGVAPDFAVVTGDLGWSGKKDELDAAHRFLVELTRVLGIAPRERLVLVPGNHDVDRSAIPRMVQRDQEAFLRLRRGEPEQFVREVGEILGAPDDLEQYGKRLQAWCEMTASLLGAARQVSPGRPWRTDVFEIGGVQVGVASLCSAWASGPDDEDPGRVVIGERQVREALDELRGTRVRIVALHHPLEWLAEPERAAVRGLLRSEAHIVLHGHLHEAELRVEQVAGGGMAVSAAGACYTGDRYPLGVQAARLDLDTGDLALHFFTHSRKDGGFWHRDPGAARGAEGGVARLRIASLAAPEPVADRGPGADEGLAARLRRQVAQVFGQINFIGLPDHAPKPNATLEDLFVPVSFGENGAREEVRDLAAVKAQLEEGARLAVLGDPGCGKTTLTRYLAVAEATREGGRVPLLVPLRELVRQGRRDGLLLFAAEDATARLSVPTTVADLERLCETGRALVLVDGLDEVADTGDRERIRDCVQALAAAYPETPVLATSRIIGYDAAPLGAPFAQLRLRPFDDGQLEQFVTAWYEVAEPKDPVERARLRGELLGALQSEPRARELARNPLLATLIALVHRYDANLPGERAKLYELVVRLLLETWPRVRRQRFGAIDEGRQREILERVALEMQEGRSGGSNESVTIGRTELERSLVAHLRERDLADKPIAEAERVAAAWVDYLTAGTGLLVEQKPGVFAFLHLSLMEYLAGRALLARELVGGDAQVAQKVAELHRQAHWREVLLLMLGSEATRGGLVDAVFGALDQVEGGDRWETAVFLLSMLREEVDVRPAERDRVLGEVASLVGERDHWYRAARLVRDIIVFGRRSGQSVAAWLRHRLLTAAGEDLQDALLLTPSDAPWSARELLSHRGDSAELVPLLLPFSPETPWGAWAQEHATARAWLEAARLAAPEQGWVWALTLEARRGFGPLLAVLYRASWLGRAYEDAAKALAHEERADARIGLPASVTWRAGTVEVAGCFACSVARLAPAGGVLPARDHFTRDLARVWAQQLEQGLAQGLGRDFARHFAGYFAGDLTRSFAPDFARRFAAAFGPDRVGTVAFEPYPARSFESAQTRERATTVESPPRTQLAPNAPISQRDLVATRDALATIADIHAGLALSAAEGVRVEMAEAVALARLQNRQYVDSLTNLVGPTLLQTLPARLLALALCAYQTTWTWPDSAPFRALFAGPPPDDWLTAHFWHLCQAAGEPGDPTPHIERAIAALDRGDPPDLVEALREHMLVPTPPDVLALFDGDPPPRTPPGG